MPETDGSFSRVRGLTPDTPESDLPPVGGSSHLWYCAAAFHQA